MTLFLFALLYLSVLCSCQELCKDGMPGLDGAWVCNDEWRIKAKEERGPLEGSTTWTLYYFLPRFYAVSKIRTVPVCDVGYRGAVFRLSASVWDEIQEYPRGPASHIPENFTWIEFDIPDVSFLEDGSQEYSGFARRSPYWRIQLNMIDIINENCLPRLLFYAKTGIAATQHFHMETIMPNIPSDIPDFIAESAPKGHTCDRVTGVPTEVVRKYRLDTSFYRKFTSAYGIPVMSSSVVDARALQRACYVVRFMLADRSDIRNHMYRNKGRVAIIGRRERVPMVPEMRIFPTFNRRAAGGTFQIPVNVGAEENMLCERGDGYARNQDIFMHEFAHGIHLIACHTALPNFNRNLQRSFMSARYKGLWRNTYANTNNQEYFAEGVQAFFNQQREGPVGGDGIQNNIDTREELRQHDPTLYKIIKGLFPCDNDYIPRCNDVGQTRGLAQSMEMNCEGGPKPPTSTTTTTTTTTTPIPTTTSTDEPTPPRNASTAMTTGITMVNTTTEVTSKLTSTTRSTTTTTATSATTRTSPPPCTDQNFYCAHWARSGECKRNPEYMLNYCKKSCNQCSSEGCMDSDRRCSTWRSYYCFSNYYVKTHCKRTCKFC